MTQSEANVIAKSIQWRTIPECAGARLDEQALVAACEVAISKAGHQPDPESILLVRRAVLCMANGLFQPHDEPQEEAPGKPPAVAVPPRRGLKRRRVGGHGYHGGDGWEVL